jgi:nucleoid-associated protein YgaU
MNLTGIIAISGRPGLYKVIAQGKNNIIVESLIDNKRFPAYATDKISALDDISIYTYDEDAPLKDLLSAIYKKEDGKMCPSHKESLTVLQNYLLELLPNYDQERVYSSDVKKMFQWYNLLHKSGNLKMEEEAAEATEIVEEVTQSETATKKPTAKKVAAPKAATAVKAKTADKAKSAKPAAGKKVAAPKTSSNRGK